MIDLKSVKGDSQGFDINYVAFISSTQNIPEDLTERKTLVALVTTLPGSLMSQSIEQYTDFQDLKNISVKKIPQLSKWSDTCVKLFN